MEDGLSGADGVFGVRAVRGVHFVEGCYAVAGHETFDVASDGGDGAGGLRGSADAAERINGVANCWRWGGRRTRRSHRPGATRYPPRNISRLGENR